MVLLNGLDHLVKEKLHIKGYGRYVDDFYLIHKDKSYLQHCLSVIRNYLGEYGLELNEKTQIFPLKNGIDFLGFHTYLTDTGKVICKVRKRSKDNMRRKMKKFAKLYRNGLTSLEKVRNSYGGWRVHASYGNTYHLIQNMDDTADAYGNSDLGINASNEGYLERHPYASREYYSLCNFNMNEVEIVDQTELPGMFMSGM